MWLRVDSGVSQRVAVLTMESRVAAMLGREARLCKGYIMRCVRLRGMESKTRYCFVDVDAVTSSSRRGNFGLEVGGARVGVDGRCWGFCLVIPDKMGRIISASS